ncbi:Intracellular sulfur oxidation protein, DsrE/DsrF family [Aquiflexum balticum DSM 16537]|uniref:Intracellular sulfur oxidation protein, DsrE/DsrF family n=1 Tax=Aquiflexum balticum DSM 16537 TaxID=758820 RepID=A0A1W2H536_9BACT|nr:DsrE family protein [Aquiflexum balticum]SMD43728.1 Intracellular sulfur oxidation protein, DsrE/DsrF family [Aquiflexum balticum DSM 16537]
MFRSVKMFLVTVILIALSISAHCQTPQFPIVKGFGGIYEIPEATERPDPNGEYKIIIDLVSASENPQQINRMVDNLARMVNLHGIAGVPKENIKIKVAVHGGAIFSILQDDYYEKLYGVKNPNLPVFEALKNVDVEFYICGQSLIARNMKTTDAWEGAEIALSMLTTLTTYVPQGYMLMRF